MSTLTNKLHTVTTNKAEIHTLQSANIKLISEVLPLINKEITTMRGENDTYKDAKKQTLAKLLKIRLDSKEGVINTALNLVILKLNVDNTLSLAKINQVIKLHKKDVLKRAWINKANKEKIEDYLKSYNLEQKIENAQKLLDK